MYHGLYGTSAQFCNDQWAHESVTRTFALICTAALTGVWQFGPASCNVRDSDCGVPCSSSDTEYTLAIVAWLAQRSATYDGTRVFQAGFSQGSLFAVYNSFCLEQHVVGFGQANSHYVPMLLHIAPTSPPLRACIWCNRDDPRCRNVGDELMLSAGHAVTTNWRDRGGHRLPLDWPDGLVDCIDLFSAASPTLPPSLSAQQLPRHLPPMTPPLLRPPLAPPLTPPPPPPRPAPPVPPPLRPPLVPPPPDSPAAPSTPPSQPPKATPPPLFATHVHTTAHATAHMPSPAQPAPSPPQPALSPVDATSDLPLQLGVGAFALAAISLPLGIGLWRWCKRRASTAYALTLPHEPLKGRVVTMRHASVPLGGALD